MFSCNVVSRWAQLVTFLNCFQDVKLSRIAIYRNEFRRMNCNLNWSLISCGELHCDSISQDKNNDKLPLVFHKTMRVFGLERLFCCCRLLITGRAVTRVFGQAFSLLSPRPLLRSLWLAPFPPLFGKFHHGAFVSKLRAQRKRLHCGLGKKWRTLLSFSALCLLCSQVDHQVWLK